MKSALRWSRHADLAIRRKSTVKRQEYLDYMTFRANERPLFTEIFGPIIGLKEEWVEQGASVEELDFSAFDFRCEERSYLPVATGRLGGRREEVLEETAEYTLSRDSLGRTMKLMKGAASLPLPMDYPVRTIDDWLRIKPIYEYCDERVATDWRQTAQAAIEAGRVVCVSIPGGFDEPRQLMGEEELCVACYERPGLIHDILDTIAETAVRVLDQVSAAIPIDLLSVHEDMAGKSGSLFGPRQIDEFLRPYYRRVWDMLEERGARLFDQDSDGDMNAVIPAFIEAGINCMHPIEPAANMDIVELRQRYGSRLAFCGGIDKHVLRRSQDEIVAELEYKIPPMVASGGCVLALDHRIPNGTPLANYRFYHQTAWEILNREAGRRSG